MADPTYEITNLTGTPQEVDAPGVAGSKKVEPDESIEVTADVATGFWGCAGWKLTKDGKEIGPDLEDEKAPAPKPSKPRKPKPPADSATEE